MKNHLIIIPLLHQPNEILHSFRYEIREKIQMNISLCRMNHRASTEWTYARGGGRDESLFFPSWLFVEDISVAGFLPVRTRTRQPAALIIAVLNESEWRRSEGGGRTRDQFW